MAGDVRCGWGGFDRDEALRRVLALVALALNLALCVRSPSLRRARAGITAGQPNSGGAGHADDGDDRPSWVAAAHPCFICTVVTAAAVAASPPALPAPAWMRAADIATAMASRPAAERAHKLRSPRTAARLTAEQHHRTTLPPRERAVRRSQIIQRTSGKPRARVATRAGPIRTHRNALSSQARIACVQLHPRSLRLSPTTHATRKTRAEFQRASRRSRSLASPIVTRRSTPPAPGDAGQNLSDLLDESFSAVTTMTTEQIERESGGALGNGGQIGNLLFDKPGITGSTFAPGASRPVIRGLDNFRVRVQENGTSTLDVSEIGEDHAVPVDTLSADRVEVVRGPATLRYGSQAIGGVVSIDNNRIPMPTTPFGLLGTDRRCVHLGRSRRRRLRRLRRPRQGRGDASRRLRQALGRLSHSGRRAAEFERERRRRRDRRQHVLQRRLLRRRADQHALALSHPRHRVGGDQHAHRSRTDETARQGRVSTRTPPSSTPCACGSARPTIAISRRASARTVSTARRRRSAIASRKRASKRSCRPSTTPFGVWTAAPGIQFNHQNLGTAARQARCSRRAKPPPARSICSTSCGFRRR